MPDTKITALTAISTVDPAVDVLPIVDVSDTTMAASGTTKKITSNQILGAGGTATLASATITGALTVGTGANAAVQKGSILGGYTVFENSAGTGNPSITFNNDIDTGLLSPAANTIAFAIGGSEAMRLNSTGLGVGVSPTTSAKIHTLGNGTNVYAVFQNGDTLATNKTSQLWLSNGPSFLGANNREYRIVNLGTSATAADLVFDYWNGTAISERMRIDSSGNVGVGVTPSAWVNFKAIQAQYACIASNRFGAGNMQTFIGSNVFYDGSNYKYIVTDTAARYAINDNSHVWFSAASGTAGTTITDFATAKMTLDASGNLLVGTTTAGANGFRCYLSTDSGTTKWSVGPYVSATNFAVVASGSAGGVYLNGTTATSWTALSDERFKDIIEPISNAVTKVGSLRAVIGKLKSDESGTRKTFLIAQDVQAVLPEAVDSSNPDKLGLAYTDVIPLLVAAIKELTARVQTLEAR